MSNRGHFTPFPTADGSCTFFSPEFGEAFHSHHGARQEAELKFVQPLQLQSKATQSQLRLLDICYGLGYNTAAAFTAIWQVNPQCYIEWVGLELNLEVPQAAITHQLLEQWPQPIAHLLTTLAASQQVATEQLQATLLIGDARTTLQTLQKSGFQADAIFLDPFSPPVCPQLWTVEFLGLAARCLQPQGHLATYSCAAAVRAALLAAGLQIGATSPVGRRSPGTLASFQGLHLSPLSPQEQEHLRTRAAVPYRDPNLQDSPSMILQRRQLEQQTSSLEPTSQWRKRWSL